MKGHTFWPPALGACLSLLAATPVASVQTGSASGPIDFERHTIPGGGQPFAIATADLDTNGTTDLAVTNPKTAQISVYLGVGDGTFLPPHHTSTGKQPRGITAADFNGDGMLDLAVAATRQNTVIVHAGTGSGALGAPRSFPTGRRPFMLAAVDLDRDGAIDLAVTNEDEAADETALSILRGDGRGNFSATGIRSGRFAADVAPADFNGDGHMDLAVGAWGSNDVIVHFGRGDATFSSTARFTYAEGHGIYRVLAVDLDRDGNTDMVWNDLRRSGLYVLYGNGAGAFPRTRLLRTGSGVRHATAADLDGDGWLDLIGVNTGANTISVVMADGRGGFRPRENIPVGELPRMVAAADLDADGRVDLVVTNMRSNDLHVLRNTGRGATSTPKGQGTPSTDGTHLPAPGTSR